MRRATAETLAAPSQRACRSRTKVRRLLFLVLSMSEGAMSGLRVISAPDTFFAKVVLSAGLLIGVAWLGWAIGREGVDPGPDGVSAQAIATRLLGIVWAT